MSTQETTEEQQPGEEGEEGEAEAPEEAPTATTSGSAEPEDPEQDRLDQITERIDKARGQAEDAGVLVDAHEETFVESGATESQDDQTIAPPG